VSDVPSPAASRIATPRWLDLRLVVGVLLVLISVVVGARVLASADHYARVYVARHALVPGQQLSASDVEVGRVRLYGQGESYVSADGSPPVGYLVKRYVGAGEFVPVEALSRNGAAPDTRLVTVPVAAGHLPSGLGRGDLVDVYVTVKGAAGAPPADPQLVIAAVPVESRDGGSRGFASSSAIAVVVSVPADRVGDVVHAVESGAIDLVRVPRDAAVAVSPAAAWSR
jgi:hypothetical protein